MTATRRHRCSYSGLQTNQDRSGVSSLVDGSNPRTEINFGGRVYFIQRTDLNNPALQKSTAKVESQRTKAMVMTELVKCEYYLVLHIPERKASYWKGKIGYSRTFVMPWTAATIDGLHDSVRVSI